MNLSIKIRQIRNSSLGVLLSGLSLLLIATGLAACSNDKAATGSEQQKTKKDPLYRESKARIDRICKFYNLDQNDSVKAQAPDDMEFDAAHGFWDHYYETWMHLVNTYTFEGNVHTALEEVKRMHQDASQRAEPYGLALANYAMGNAYNNMGQLEEALKCYDQSLDYIRETNDNKTTVIDIYSYYCDALNEQKKYVKMIEVTSQWHSYMERLMGDKEDEGPDGRVWKAYYHLACAQRDLGLGLLDDAETHIHEAELRQDGDGEFIMMSVLYYKAQLLLQKKDYEEALALNTARLKKSLGYDDKSSLVLIREQRAKILEGLGMYEEEAQMYKEVSALTDSMYKKDTRTQLNELSALFNVTEMNIVRRLERTRAITVVAVVIALALAILLAYWYWTNRRLRRKNEELAIARDQAQESSRMKSDFIKNISHEIRTPLNILSGFTQVITQPDMELTPEMRQDANKKIQDNTERITTLINQLLALSESNSRSHIERCDKIEANQLCHQAIVQSGVSNKGLHHFTFSSAIESELIISTNERYATQAMTHLLDNARKFTPKGGDIRMKAWQEGDLLNIAIEDTGCGIPAEKADAVFQEFVQLDEYKEGVGIGLSVARNIARRLGGDIILDSTYHQGARFVMTLPAE